MAWRWRATAGSWPSRKVGGAFGLARLNTDGTLDATFSDNGKQTIDAALPGDDGSGVDGVLQADGKLVIVGTTAGGDFALARFHGDAAGSQSAGSEHTADADHAGVRPGRPT